MEQVWLWSLQIGGQRKTVPDTNRCGKYSRSRPAFQVAYLIPAQSLWGGVSWIQEKEVWEGTPDLE